MRTQRTLVAVTVALLVLAPIAFALGPGLATAQSQNPPYSVQVVEPDKFSTDGTQTLAVSVTNNADDAFLNPIVEVPIQSPISLTASATDNVYVDGDTSETRLAEVQDSTFATGDALVITGEDIPADATRTYYFNVTVSTSGTTSVTADVRPMYNEERNVRSSTAVTALGTGTIDASVVNPDETSVSGAQATIDGEARSNDVSATVLEGTHDVSVAGLDGDYPTFDFTVGVGDTRSATFVKRDDAKRIQAIAYTGNDVSRISDSVTRTAGGPETTVDTTVSFTFAKGSGTVYYEVQDPSIETRRVADVTVTDGTLVEQEETADGDLRLKIDPTGTTTQVDVTYEGYELGNVNGDGVVNAADADRVANRLANGQTQTTAYADVNGDGRVSAVDAMLIAQYGAGENPSEYTGVDQ